MMDEAEIEALATILEARLHQHEAARHHSRRKHWPRRAMLVCVVVIAAGLIHYVVEDVGLRSAAQSGEMVLAALFEAVFTKAREFE